MARDNMEVHNLNLNGIVGLFDNNFGDWGATRTGIFVGLHGVVVSASFRLFDLLLQSLFGLL